MSKSNVRLSNKRKIILEDKNSKKIHLSGDDSANSRNPLLHPENPVPVPENSDFTPNNANFNSVNTELNNQLISENNKLSEKKLRRDELLLLFNNCVTALSNNKICTYNAFDIGIIDHIDDLIQINEEESGPGTVGERQRSQDGTEDINYSMISKVVESASKVYSYRVEAIYNKTFNILTNIKSKNNNENANINKRSKKNIKLYEFTGKNTLLLKNEVTLSKLEVDNVLMDPYFLKISSLFNNSLNLLMLNILIHNLLISLFNTNTYTNPVKDSVLSVNATSNGADLRLNKSLLSEIVRSDQGTRTILPEINQYIEQLYGTTHNPFEILSITTQSEIPDDNPDDIHLGDLNMSELPESEMVPEGANEPLDADDVDAFYDAVSTHEFPEIYTADNSQISDFNSLTNTQDVGTQLTDLVPREAYLSNVPGSEIAIDGILENVTVKRRKAREVKIRTAKPVTSLVKFVLENNLSTVLDSVELLSYYNKKIKFSTSNRSFNLNLSLNPNKLLVNNILISQSSDQVSNLDCEVKFVENEHTEDVFEPGMGEFDCGDEAEPEPADTKVTVVDINKLKKAIMSIFESEGRNLSFSQLISSVYKRFDRNVVTVHIIFVCLLHVSNEHNLFLHGDSINFSIQE
ncbi:Condensin complex subunit 2 family protein [Theileria parva strain Muguga]|uniref:Condensin complex subunit 2 family protein n=1 Tax=Theileria parva strain Muguga TaxID=333668 RepID=UPI001C617BE4|nr:Condensin complex subunit 2 family protein [Theileria parva strain Muguga]EAN30846.2 Condensin complex subunit 2 family protein [Theileria parva strain Muguga]